MHRFTIVLGTCGLAGFAVVDMLKYCAVFVGSFVQVCLKIRTSPTWVKHPDNFSDKLKTTKDPTKAVQYFIIPTAANYYSLESMVIEEENPKLYLRYKKNNKL